MKRIRLAVIILVVIVIISAGIWWLAGSTTSEATPDILTSGFIEATSVAIAPEVGGRIVEITADEGDRIEAGANLIKLDDSLLSAQKEQSEAAVKIAKLALEQAMISREQATISADGAKNLWKNATDVLANPLELEARIIAAQGELDIAALNYKQIMEYTLPNWYQEQTARLRYETARSLRDNLLSIRDNPQAINATVEQAYIAYQTATQAVALAEKAVEIAKIQVEQAETSLKVIDLQLGKLGSYSPVSGVVTARYAEVGEIARAGATILTVSVLDEVTLTAYIPESKIGLVKLGQKALVSVDSYPGKDFSGEITYISPQAQFTPRNVQLKEEREKMVFAVKIKLDNPDWELKPGMPADARIITGCF
ncbi:MAG: efflux RND transporter periplasmic adaptor subunit [Chloroflexota bacterium]